MQPVRLLALPWIAAVALAGCDGGGAQPRSVGLQIPEPTEPLRPVEQRGSVPEQARVTDYAIDAKLDEESFRITGLERITFRNRSDAAVDHLALHLYMNAFSAADTAWMKEGRGSHRAMGQGKDTPWGRVEVTSIGMVDGAGALTLEPGVDPTVATVPLPSPVQPGQSIEVDIGFTTHLPEVFARTGFKEDFVLAGQWFPKLAVLQHDGTWNNHVFTFHSEFFADFGDYRVILDVPKAWVVGASGIRTAEEDDGERRRLTYEAAMVHDFAWTADPRFEVKSYLFEFEEWAARFPEEVEFARKALGPDAPLELRDVHVTVLIHPERVEQAERHREATEAALFFYGLWFGEYPFEHVAAVDPPWGGRAAGGMEYPTLFTCGTRMLTTPDMHSPEGVTVHECGHQFFYGLVGNNEFEAGWLDEGFNTYSTTRTTQAAFGSRSLVERYFEGFIPIAFDDIAAADRTDGADRHRGFDSALKRDPQATLSYQTGPGGYRVNAYDKGALSLRTLENYLGWVTFQRVMSTYFARYRFAHPKPEDFFAVAEEVSGVDLEWFWRQAYSSTAVYDYAVGKVSAYRDGSARGYVDDASGTPSLAAGGDDAQWRSVVVARRLGDGVFPVNVDIEFEDGSRVVERWDGEARWTRFSYRRDSKVAKVRVDPGRQLVLDINRTNNSWARRSKAGLAATKWGSKWMVWVQASMEAMAFFS